ncbi:tpr domain-containing protein [Fusarium mundagurra]|uniref:Tpr domain-containing protein n=1 Tax=Fusarium mundagurra TaxID=1567541 RepID=A0A8H6DLN2_9HYPO|nr:tpr domain-containing protein [Fusarium mundagurra]
MSDNEDSVREESEEIRAARKRLEANADCSEERVRQLRELTDLLVEDHNLDGAIQCHRETIKLIPQDQVQADDLMDLVTLNYRRFSLSFGCEGSGASYLDDAIQAQRDVLKLLPDDQHQASGLKDLGDLLFVRYKIKQIRWEIEQCISTDEKITDVYLSSPDASNDLEEAIKVSEDALAIVEMGWPERQTWLLHLSILYKLLHYRNGTMVSLENAIQLAQEAREIMQDENTDVSAQLSELLEIRYVMMRNDSDIKEAINLARENLSNATPENRHWSLGALARVLFQSYKMTKTVKHLDEAISATITGSEEGLRGDKIGITEIGNSNFLYDLLSERYETAGDLLDLDRMIDMARYRVNLMLPKVNERLQWETLLNAWWRYKIGFGAHSSDIKRAIDHPANIHIYGVSKITSLDELARPLNLRYLKTGEPEDIVEAVNIMRRLVKLSKHPSYLLRLGMYLLRLYDEKRDPKAADEGEWVSKQLELHPDGWEYSAGQTQHWYLNYQARELSLRYEITGDRNLLEKAIIVAAKVVEMPDVDTSGRATELYSLATITYQIFSTTQLLSDLEKAIDYCKRAYDLMPENDTNRPHCLARHSRCLLQQYKFTLNLTDLNEAIRIGQQAVMASRDTPYLQEKILDGLAAALYQRFLAANNRHDLDEAIVLGRQAVDLKLEDPMNGCPYFLSLAAMLCDLHTLTEGEESLDYLGEALQLVHLVRENTLGHERQHPDLARIICRCPRTLYLYPPVASEDDLQTNSQYFRNILTETRHMSCSVRAQHATDLALALSCFFSYGIPTDIDEPVSLARDAITMAQDGDQSEHLAWHFCGLVIALRGRFSATRNPKDLVGAISLGRRAVDMTSEDDPRRAFYLIIYATALHCRYSHTGRLADLSSCIEIGLKAWYLSSRGTTPGDYYNQINCAGNVAKFLQDRYLLEGQAFDLERAMELQHLVETRRLILGRGEPSSFFVKHKGSRITGTAPYTPTMQRKGVSLYDVPNSSYLAYNLSFKLLQHYKKFQSKILLSDLILICQVSVNSTSRRHKEMPKYQHLLGSLFATRYEDNKLPGVTDQEQRATPNLVKDLNSAVKSLEQVIDTASEADQTWTSAVLLLGPLYSDKYALFGDIGDLKMSLAVLRESTRALREDDSRYLNLLRLQGSTIMKSFTIFNRQGEIDLAKQIFWQALRVMDESCPSRPASLVDLAEVYQAEHRNTRSKQSLDISLELYDGAVGIMGDSSDCIRPQDLLTRIFTGRAFSYLERYKTTRNPTYLEKSIENIKEVLKPLATNSVLKINPLVTLANAYIAGYTTTQDNSYLASTDQLLNEASDIATSATSVDDLSRVTWLVLIGESYKSRYHAAKLDSDLDQAVQFLNEAFDVASLNATRDLSRLASIAKSLTSALKMKKDWNKAYLVIKQVVPLIAATTPRFLDISESQFLLSKYSTLASEGAALAMSAGCEPMEAIQLLEAGRGVAMLALNELRLDLTSAAAIGAEHRERLATFQQELEYTLHSSTLNVENDTHGREAILKQFARRIQVGRDLNEFVHNLHALNYQMAFSETVRSAHLAQASLGGPIVVINVHYRCDAFLIRGAMTRALTLPKLSMQAVQDRVDEGNFTSLSVLEWLWDSIVSPVLDALGYTGPPSRDDPWPRIWWIPTGSLSKFPLHAAGRHLEEQSFNSTIDRVISSYSPSIRALVETVNRGENTGRNQPQQAQQALIVSMEHTPDTAARLPNAVAETQVVEEACGKVSIRTIRPDRCTKDSVLAHLPSSDIFHFAGHGYTDNADPSKSHLRLEDWKTDPLTVSDLIAINLRKQKPFLAYLGACGTGEIQDARHLDESVHLISGCQLAGFRHVIGTLCRVNDKTCVDVAVLTYEVICQKGLTDASVSEGLHYAVRELRDRWRLDHKQQLWKENTSGFPRDANHDADMWSTGQNLDYGLRDVVAYDSDDDTSGNTPLQWAPYVHYGC